MSQEFEGYKKEILPSRDESARPKGRQVKDGEVWITIRVPEQIKDWIHHVALQNERSESYIARCILLDTIQKLRGQDGFDYIDRLMIPEAENRA